MPVATTETRMRPSSVVVERRAEDDVGVGIDFVADAVGGLVDFEQRHVHAAGDVDQHAARALHRDVVEQRVGDRGLGRLDGAAFRPRPSPVPIIALPISLITVRTSAKSRLIRPGMTIRSVTPRTPECSTSSASWKASAKVVFSLAMRNRFWFGMTISVSTYCCSSWMPASASLHAVRAFEVEGLGDHADGQDAVLARRAGDDRRRAGAGAAAHAGGDEHHVASLRDSSAISRALLRPRRGRHRDASRRRGPG